jgi:hypothetical protein
MLCTFCGTDNNPENKFCGMCGVRLERRKIERRVRHGTASLKCASCGHVCEAGTTFCGMCGARIERRVTERRTNEERANAIANVQLPSPEVPEAPEAPAPRVAPSENIPAESAGPQGSAEEELPAIPPQAEISPRPPAAIFRNTSPAARSTPAEHPGISGPSFLGLSEPESSTGEYLLEEEKSSGALVRTLVFLVLVAVVAGLVFLQWRSGLRASQKGPEPAKPVPAVASPEDTKPKAESSSTPDIANTSSVAEASPAPAAAATSDKSPDAQPDSAKSSVAATPEPAVEKSKAESTNSEDTSTPAKNAAAKEKARQEAASLKPSAALLRAQDYLQGRNGVKQDCDQGLAYLRAAVQRSEPAAAMQMGELYANGRCVQQDRVMAYRWMNSAREKAPGNPTIQMTVDQLWGRMTPQERSEAGR